MTLTAIDLFCGAGGTTTGATMAGIKVLLCVNHWDLALQLHAANHPDVIHHCQDLQQYNFNTCPDHDILCASPACQGHSEARGKEQPRHDALRNTAWAVVSAVEAKEPRAFVVENVPEFTKWQLYPYWLGALQEMGYHTTVQVLDAADFGVPQHRERVFIVGCREGAVPITPPGTPHVPAREIIDFTLPLRRQVDTLAPSTRARIVRGREQHGNSFLIAYYGRERGGRSLDHPLGTITTKEKFALVVGDYMRMLAVDEYRAAMGFPRGYLLPYTKAEAVKVLGNAVPPLLAKGVLTQVAAALTA